MHVADEACPALPGTRGSTCFFLLFGATLIAAPGDKPAVCVLDFQLTGISAQEGRMIVGYFNTGVVEASGYRVIDRMQRDALLKEIEFSNAECTDQACQLKIGKLISARLIIVGSLGKVGDLFMLNLRKIDVETSETVWTASAENVLAGQPASGTGLSAAKRSVESPAIAGWWPRAQTAMNTLTGGVPARFPPPGARGGLDYRPR